jgi:ketosteroid isomerase-like protein
MPGDLELLAATNRIFDEEVVGKGDFAALERVYTAGARVMPPGSETITGMDNIKAFWAGAAAALGVTACKLNSVEVEFHGETAVEIGRANLSTVNGPVDVKYVVAWKREGGAWKWDIDIWNHVA